VIEDSGFPKGLILSIFSLSDVNQSLGADFNPAEKDFSSNDQLNGGILFFDYPNSAIIGDVSLPISCENEILGSS
jgi:hypothetical protein